MLADADAFTPPRHYFFRFVFFEPDFFDTGASSFRFDIFARSCHYARHDVAWR